MENKLLRQVLMVSKLIFYGFVLQCFFISMLLAAESEAQAVRSVKEVSITVSFEDDNLIDAFRKIERKTRYKFAFNKGDLSNDVVLNRQFVNASIYEVLVELSKEADLKFKQINNTINVDRLSQKEKGQPAKVDIFLQTMTVTGKITSAENEEELPGVNVVIKGTTSGTVSDINGNYSIEVPSGNSVLVFSYIGFISEEVNVSERSVIDLSMTPDITALEEIVVIGYGEVQKEDLTGAVGTLGNRDFNPGVTTTPQDLLTGRIAGVTVTSNSGAPGSGTTIRIRGGSSLGGATNDPLIVIDGFPIDDGDISGLSNPLNTINPNDIESFTVLKDASAAAIYGARASNGVIIITTKKGMEGDTKLSYNGQFSIGTPIKYVDVLNGDEYRQLINERSQQAGTGITPEDAERLGNENTDWQDEIYRNAFSQNHSLTAKGAVASIPYRLSYGFTDQEGILKNTDVKRHTLSLNLNPTFLDDHLKVNLNAKGTYAHSNFGDEGAVGAAVSFDPTQPVFNGNERYNGYFTWTTETLPDGSMDPEGTASTFVTNPVSSLNLRDNQADVYRFIGNIQLDYKFHFLPDLRANLNLGLDKTDTDGHDNYLPGSTFVYRDYVDPEHGRLLDYTENTKSELLEAYLNYSKEIGIHKIDLTAGYSWQHWRRGSTTYDRNGLEEQVRLNTRTVVVDGEAIETDNPDENFLVSVYGRLMYTLNNKYLLTATIRQDGSSRFVGDNQKGVFPSVALAWKINEESFLENAGSLSNLKLRLGYGVTGQQGLSPTLNDPYYPAIAKYEYGVGSAYYLIDGEYVLIARPAPYDANLKWEETTTYNVGLDFGFIEDKITGSVDVYKRETTDLLNRIPIPDGSNFGNFLTTNVGSMEIRGYEITLGARPVVTPDFNWYISANLTYNKREITKLNKTADPSDPGVPIGSIGGGGLESLIKIHTVGQSPESYYTFQQVFDEDGNPIEGLYVDRSGEGGEVDANQFNKYHNHNPYPDYLVGINSRLQYKQLDFSFSGRLSLGNYAYNNGENQSLNGLFANSTYFNNIRTRAYEIGFEDPQVFSDIYVQDASFFKMDNISLGYSFQEIFKKLNARISLTVQNAFIITDYSGIDPEVGGTGDQLGIDNNIYPRPRTYLLGLNLDF